MTTSHTIRYTVDHDPIYNGCYAVRIDEHGMLQDKFLSWHNGHWFQPLSDRTSRDQVLGWVGPLCRTLPTPQHGRDAKGRFATSPEDHHHEE